MERLNEDIYLPLKMGRFDHENPDYKKLMVFMNKLKKNNEDDYSKLQGTIERVMRFINKHKIKQGVI